MTESEVRAFLRHNKSGVLSLADEGRAYAVPLFYAYDGRALYFMGREGEKTRFAESTQEACFTVVRTMSLDDWASAQAFGRVERVGTGPDRIAAHAALMAVPLPPEFGESPHGEPARSARHADIYRLTPTRVSGRYSQRHAKAGGNADIATRGM